LNTHRGLIRVLSVEDNPADAALIQELLAEATRLGWNLPRFEVTHVSRLEHALTELESERAFDAVLTDLDLPDSRSDATFRALRAHAPTLPIVVLTSRNDVDLARQTVRAGAEDYLFKRELSGSLLAHALLYALERQEYKQALHIANETLEARVAARTRELQKINAALRESEERFRLTFEAAPVGVTRTALNGHWLHANKRFCEIVGYTPEELADMRWQDLTHPDDLTADEQETRHMLEGKSNGTFLEKRYIRKDGTVIWVQMTATLVRKPTGEPAYFIAVIQDITARKEAEAALEQSEARYRSLSEKAPVGIFHTSSNGRVLDCNERMAQMLGYEDKEEALQAYTDLERQLYVDPARRCALLARLEADGAVENFENEVRHRDGSHIWLNICARVSQHKPDGSLIIDGFATEITARKQMETILRHESNLLHTLMENFPDTIYFKDVNHRFTRINIAQARALGVDDPVEAVGKTDADFFGPTFAQKSHQDERRILETGEPLINKVEKVPLPNGTFRWVLATKVPIFDADGNVAGIAGVSRDITERKTMEEALRKSEQRFRTFFESAPDAIFVEDLNGTVLNVNPAACRLHRTSRETLIGKHVTDLVPSAIREEVRRTFPELRKQNRDWTETYCLTEGGESVPIELTTRLIEYEGRPAILLHARDITDLKNREEALRESEARYRGLFENAPISLWEEDFSAVKIYLDRLRESKGQDVERYLVEYPEAVAECLARIRFVDFNQATLDLYRAESKTELHQHLETILADETHLALRRILLAIVHGETRAQAETINYTLDGAKIHVRVDWRVAPGHEETLATCFVSIQDITELKKIQATLQRTNAELKKYAAALERSNEALTHFGYVTSHDLREPLHTVIGFLQLLKRYHYEQLDEKARLYVEQAIKGSRRMSQMIQALLDLSRVETRGRPFEVVNVESVLQQTLEALQQAVEESGAVITHDPLPDVAGDAAQLGQLLQNLLSNAIKFHRDGVPPRVHISSSRREGSWCFAVRDNGIGIAPQQSKCLFRAFQRLHTEEEYPGVGIGLALCKRIVERHGGRIWVESAPGEGATFYFTLRDAETALQKTKHERPKGRESLSQKARPHEIPGTVN